MRRLGVIAVFVVISFVAGWAVVHIRNSVREYQETWIGFYPLTVHIDTPDPPRAVACWAFRDREKAE